ncbi:MAG: hypothetical protein JWM33_2598 [Caulobacteraceae bacterium]|nr:hypothetical protein [Caulobacteraceae bacterium]
MQLRGLRSDAAAPLSPGFRLALACAAWPPSPQRCDLIRRAAADITDWDEFVAITRRNRIGGLARNGLKLAGLDIPPEVARQAGAIAVAGHKLAAETLRLHQAFADAALPVAFLKGASLAWALFGDVGLRHAKDIDALIDRRSIAAAWAVLESLGYRRITPPADLAPHQLEMFFDLSKDSAFFHPDLQVWVELHWRLNDDPGLPAAPDPSAWVQASLGPAGTVTTFGDSDLFLYLCVHGSTHGWKRLKWLADIAAWLGARPHTVDQYWLAASGSGAEPAVEVAMRLCAILFGSPLPQAMPQAARRRVRLLMALATASLTGGGTRWPSRLLDRMAEPLAGLLLCRDLASARAWAKHHLLPAEDLLILRLPPALSALYPVARLPLWILKTLTRHGPRKRRQRNGRRREVD